MKILARLQRKRRIAFFYSTSGKKSLCILRIAINFVIGWLFSRGFHDRTPSGVVVGTQYYRAMAGFKRDVLKDFKTNDALREL